MLRLTFPSNYRTSDRAIIQSWGNCPLPLLWKIFWKASLHSCVSSSEPEWQNLLQMHKTMTQEDLVHFMSLLKMEYSKQVVSMPHARYTTMQGQDTFLQQITLRHWKFQKRKCISYRHILISFQIPNWKIEGTKAAVQPHWIRLQHILLQSN